MKKILAFVLTLTLFAGVADARKVKGSVCSGEERLSGVIVTDGVNFTKTGDDGKFSFNIEDDAEFVYIVTPSGYVADWTSGVPAFYQRAEGVRKFNFDLAKSVSSEDYTIVAIADPQAGNQKHFQKFSDKPMADLCQTISQTDGAVVGLALGDICWDQFDILDMYKKEIVRTGIPFYPVIGNHDHDLAVQGDIETSASYRVKMGPENYAFFMGDDVVVVLDNIIYDTKKKYQEGYAEHVLSWVENLLKHVPAESDIIIAQHSPSYFWEHEKMILNTDRLLDILKPHVVTFLSGHTHINNFFEYAEGVTEHNVAAICGSWWDVDYCTDGTPGGYKVFTKKDGRTSWYYKSVGQDRSYQVEVYDMGQAKLHPNSVVVNVWDWDPQWKVEWYEDGIHMGQLEPVKEYSPIYGKKITECFAAKDKPIPGYKCPRANYHYFAATPSQYARKVTVNVESRFGQKWSYDFDMSGYVDVQAHRGGAGLMPENTILAMKHALDMGVNTLELDLQVSQDGQIVVSHDPYFHHRYATRPDGSAVQKDDPKEYIYTMPYSEVVKYDVGIRPSTVWPEKACIEAVKPLASELIDFVENYTKEMGYSPVRYNIEVKSKNAEGEGVNWPGYEQFAAQCCELLLSKGLGDRLVVQSFDVRALDFMHDEYPQLILSYLVDAKAPSFEEYMALLDFTPQWLSPHHSITDEELVRKCHEKGMKIVPWTVDKPEDIRRMIEADVDAIISNYPDRVLMQTRGYN